MIVFQPQSSDGHVGSIKSSRKQKAHSNVWEIQSETLPEKVKVQRFVGHQPGDPSHFIKSTILHFVGTRNRNWQKSFIPQVECEVSTFQGVLAGRHVDGL